MADRHGTGPDTFCAVLLPEPEAATVLVADSVSKLRARIDDARASIDRMRP
jgi:hypothetical protein